MENSSGFGGSRSEFLPGEGYDDSDIKYQRYGGCFISTKKGFAYVLLSVATVVVASGLVYFYAPRWKDKMISVNDENSDTSALIDMLQSSQKIPKINEESQKIQKNFIPYHYQLFIQPYLEEDPGKNFTFEGNVTIIFHVEKATRTLLLSAKELDIMKPMLVTYETTSTVKDLKSASQVLNETVGNITENAVPNNENSTIEAANSTSTTSTTSTTTSTVAPPVDNATAVSQKITPNDTSTTTSTTKPVNLTVNTNSTSNAVPSSVTPTPVPGINVSSTVAPEVNSSTTASTTSSTTVAPSTSAPEIAVNVPTNLNIVRVNKFDTDEDGLRIELETKLKEGINYTIQIIFKGKLSDKDGLVKSSYLDDNGNKSWSAITNFHSNSARKVFPCIDEPWYKAKYQINVARRTSKMTLSNMPIKESAPHITDNGWIWDIYDETPALSIHSVAFAVYNLLSKKIPSDPGAVMQIWGRKSLIEKANYATDITPKLLNFYNTFFGYHYPLSKIDLIAIPNLFADSTENFGLMSFSENIALVDKDSPNSEKELLLNNMAYDFSRQWFGGIVTVKNRNESWILSGLSTYMQYLGVNEIEPTWGKLSNFLTMTQDVLDADTHISLKNNFVTDEEETSFTHKKACSIIRMLNNSLTDLVFIKGLRNYIDAWKYQNAEDDSLWNILTQVGHNTSVLPKDISVKNMVDTWTNQNELPLLVIERNYEKGSVKIQQVSEANNASWILPINYITADTKDWNSLTTNWIKEPSTNIENVTSPNSDKWILFNIQQTTPCRINYDLKNWNLLAKQLQESPNLIPPINRAQLIDDAFQLAKHGQLDYEVVFNLTSYLKDKEKNYIPWAAALKNFDDFFLILYKSAEYGYFQDYMIQLLTPIYNDLGVVAKDTDTYSISSLRTLVISWACKLKHKPCKDWMYSQYQTWANFSDPDGTHPLEYELRGSMYCVGVRERGRSAWDFLWERFKFPTVKENEKKALLTGMGCARDSWMLIRYFQRALNASEISLKDSTYVWNSLPYDFAIHEAFEFLREYWKEVQDNYVHHDNLMKAIISGLFSKLSTKNELNEITRFFFAHTELKPYTKQVAEAAKSIKTRLEWKNNYLQIVSKYLRNIV